MDHSMESSRGHVFCFVQPACWSLLAWGTLKWLCSVMRGVSLPPRVDLSAVHNLIRECEWNEGLRCSA